MEYRTRLEVEFYTDPFTFEGVALYALVRRISIALRL